MSTIPDYGVRELSTDTQVASGVSLESVVRKVSLRILPFLFIMYIFNYLDRQNVAYAKLVMLQDLNLSEVVYATGAGVFFWGYFLFEVPSNLMLQRVGARLWISRIMITWGIISCSMMFIHSAMSFYFLRFLLGVAEAGFFPGMILYLTYWFPQAERARAISRFMIATPLSGVLGSPLSTEILARMKGVGGLKSWQWLFIIEGIPSFLLGFVVFFYLTDKPKYANWLTTEEKNILQARLDMESDVKQAKHGMSIKEAFANITIIQLTLFYLLLQVAIYGFNNYLPTIIKDMHVSLRTTGFLGAIPYICAAIGMVVVGAMSDKSGNRKLAVGGSSILAAFGLLAGAYAVNSQNLVLAIVCFSFSAIGLWSTLGPFWSLPTSFLGGSAAAAGIAFINSIGNLGGFVGPQLMGWGKQITGKDVGGLIAIGATMLVAALLINVVKHDRSLESGSELVES